MVKIIARIITVLIMCSAMNVLAEETSDQTPEYDQSKVVVSASKDQGVASVGPFYEITGQDVDLLPGFEGWGMPMFDIRAMRSFNEVRLLNPIAFNAIPDSRLAQLSMGYDSDDLFSLKSWNYLSRNDDPLGFNDDEYATIIKSNYYDEIDVTGATVQGFLHLDTLGRLGFSLNSESNFYDSNVAYGNDDFNTMSHDLFLYAAAIEYETTLFDRLGVVAGYSHHWLDKNHGDDDDQGAWLTGVSYDLAQNTRLRASYARKIRFASIKNLYDADAGNEDLDTETSDNYEFGVSQLLPYGIMADFNVFQNNVKDYIQKAEQPNGKELYENYDEYRLKGIELFLSKKFSKAGASFGYAYMDAESKSEAAVFDEQDYRSLHKFTLEGNYAFDFGLIAYASLMYLTDKTSDGDDDQGDLGDITLVDLKIEQRIYKQICSFYLGVNNLFDEDYDESYGLLQAGRTTYAGMKIRF